MHAAFEEGFSREGLLISQLLGPAAGEKEEISTAPIILN